uniref:Uncharacterized protein n=1 Tax=Glossina austeni TaxID=7395 RepID=A0A1A9VAV7_GLOAU
MQYDEPTVETTIRLKHWVGNLLSYMSIRVLLEKVFAATTIVLCNYAIVVEVLLSTPCKFSEYFTEKCLNPLTNLVRMFCIVCSPQANLMMDKPVGNLQIICITTEPKIKA